MIIRRRKHLALETASSNKILDIFICDREFVKVGRGYKNLKEPKQENFLLAFFAQSEPIWAMGM
jgi:hypothetical protein